MDAPQTLAGAFGADRNLASRRGHAGWLPPSLQVVCRAWFRVRSANGASGQHRRQSQSCRRERPKAAGSPCPSRHARLLDGPARPCPRRETLPNLERRSHNGRTHRRAAVGSRAPRISLTRRAVRPCWGRRPGIAFGCRNWHPERLEAAWIGAEPRLGTRQFTAARSHAVGARRRQLPAALSAGGRGARPGRRARWRAGRRRAVRSGLGADHGGSYSKSSRTLPVSLQTSSPHPLTCDCRPLPTTFRLPTGRDRECQQLTRARSRVFDHLFRHRTGRAICSTVSSR